MYDVVEEFYTNSIPNKSRGTSLEVVSWFKRAVLKYSFRIGFVDSVVHKLSVKPMDPIPILY